MERIANRTHADVPPVLTLRLSAAALLALVLWPSLVFGQPAPEPTHFIPPVSFEPTPTPGPVAAGEVVTVDGATKDQLYSAALAWFGETFRSAKSVIDIPDRDAGRIVGKPLFDYEPVVFLGSTCLRGPVRYVVTVEVKDGRYRYSVGEFRHEGTLVSGCKDPSIGLITTDPEPPPSVLRPLPKGSRAKTWSALQSQCGAEATRVAQSLRKRMAQAAKKADDW